MSPRPTGHGAQSTPQPYAPHPEMKTRQGLVEGNPELIWTFLGVEAILLHIIYDMLCTICYIGRVWLGEILGSRNTGPLLAAVGSSRLQRVAPWTSQSCYLPFEPLEQELVLL